MTNRGSRLRDRVSAFQVTIGDVPRATAATAAVVAVIVYVRTLMPGVSFGDWAEMQTVPHVLGIAHPTGYPTYILLAWLAELAPIGSVAWRANLLSAVLVAGSVATLVLIALRLGVRASLALPAALAFGVIGTVWAAATVAEVNPLHLFLTSLLIHRLLRWSDGRAPSELVLGGLLLGLSVGNHLLTLFVAPFIVASALWVGRHELWRHRWILPATAGASLMGLAVYIYIPLAAAASPPLPYNHPVTLDGVLWLASGEQFRFQFDFLSPGGPPRFVASLPSLWSLLAARATVAFPLVGLGGLALLVLRRPAFGLACAGMLVSALYVWANYQELEHYLLGPLLVLAIGTAVALEASARGAAAIGRRLARRDGAPVVAMAALAFAVVLAGLNWSAADRSADRSGQEYVDAVFSALPANAAIVSYWDPSAPLWYGQHVEGLRPDVLIVDDTNIVYEGWGSAVRRVADLICQRPVFLIRVGDPDLAPFRSSYRLTLFMTVRIGALGPSATVSQRIFRVEPLPPRPC